MIKPGDPRAKMMRIHQSHARVRIAITRGACVRVCGGKGSNRIRGQTGSTVLSTPPIYIGRELGGKGILL